MAIQVRRGNNAYFDESKMKSGEMAVAEDTEQVYVSFQDGTAEEIALKRDVPAAGADGASAYEVAVANGFEGSEAEWLESLKGEKGDTGEKGADGTMVFEDLTDEQKASLKGEQGEKGADGKSAYQTAVEAGYTGTEEEFMVALNTAANFDSTTTKYTTTITGDGATQTFTVTHNLGQRHVFVQMFDEYNDLMFADVNCISESALTVKFSSDTIPRAGAIYHVLVLAFGTPETASDISYDNSVSGLAAGNLQSAVDEMASDLSNILCSRVVGSIYKVVGTAEYSSIAQDANGICTFSYKATGHAAMNLALGGDYSTLIEKKYRVKVKNTGDSTATSIRVFMTNSQYAWGSSSGTINVYYYNTAKDIEPGEHITVDVSVSEASYMASYSGDLYLYVGCKDASNGLDTILTWYVEEMTDDFEASSVQHALSANVAAELEGFNPANYYTSEQTDALFAGAAGDYITCWGDSLTAQGGWTYILESLSGYTVHNAGTGGESSFCIMARQGADTMIVNDITIPAEIAAVQIATYSSGIKTQLGQTVRPLLQGGTAHVNPVMIGDVEGTLAWTGSSYSDTTGTWTFTRTTAGEAVTIDRPTAIRTMSDVKWNSPRLMVIFMGQNDGSFNIEALINRHRLMINHADAGNVIVLGLSSGTEESRAEYEEGMRGEFGRYFISIREYLSTPIYDSNGEVVSCYGLSDSGLTATEEDIEAIETGKVPPQMLADSVHFTAATKTVIGNLIYKRCCELGIF